MNPSRPGTVTTAARSSGSLSHRRRRPELMDDPALPEAEHRAALAGLARLNRLSGAASGVWRTIRRRLPAGSEIGLLDVACGGGDVAVGLARRARQEGVDLRVTACDIAPVALRVTRERFARQGLDAACVSADALAGELPGPFDVVFSSLFLHHLGRSDAVAALRAMAKVTGRLLLVDDLRRDLWGDGLAAVVPRLVTRSRVVHVDARRSVRAAFTVAELEDLAAEAGLAGAVVIRRWPARQMLVWTPPEGRGDVAGEVR